MEGSSDSSSRSLGDDVQLPVPVDPDLPDDSVKLGDKVYVRQVFTGNLVFGKVAEIKREPKVFTIELSSGKKTNFICDNLVPGQQNDLYIVHSKVPFDHDPAQQSVQEPKSIISKDGTSDFSSPVLTNRSISTPLIDSPSTPEEDNIKPTKTPATEKISTKPSATSQTKLPDSLQAQIKEGIKHAKKRPNLNSKGFSRTHSTESGSEPIPLGSERVHVQGTNSTKSLEDSVLKETDLKTRSQSPINLFLQRLKKMFSFSPDLDLITKLKLVFNVIFKSNWIDSISKCGLNCWLLLVFILFLSEILYAKDLIKRCPKCWLIDNYSYFISSVMVAHLCTIFFVYAEPVINRKITLIYHLLSPGLQIFLSYLLMRVTITRTPRFPDGVVVSSVMHMVFGTLAMVIRSKRRFSVQQSWYDLTFLIFSPFIATIPCLSDYVCKYNPPRYRLAIYSLIYAIGLMIWLIERLERQLLVPYPLKAYTISRTKKLIVYGFLKTRHPNYCGFFIMTIGWSLVAESVYSILIPIAVFFYLNRKATKSEEGLKSSVGPDIWDSFMTDLPKSIYPKSV